MVGPPVDTVDDSVGRALQLIVEGATAFGRPIKVYVAPFLGNVTIVEALN